jgi:hypothetical protein
MAQATLGIISAFFFDKFCHFFTKNLFLNFFCFFIVHSTNFANFLETFANFLISENWGKNPLVITMCAPKPLHTLQELVVFDLINMM